MSAGGVVAGGSGRMTQAERDERSRQRRAEVLRLPMVPLRPHAYLARPGYYPSEPLAVGVGPDDIAMAAWPARKGDRGWSS
jgi:hypothetical protein